MHKQDGDSIQAAICLLKQKGTRPLADVLADPYLTANEEAGMNLLERLIRAEVFTGGESAQWVCSYLERIA